MRWTLVGKVTASLLAVGGVWGPGASTAQACDHWQGGAYGRAASWGYQAEYDLTAPARFGASPAYDRCPICYPAPPICEPPPCEGDGFVARETRREVDIRVRRDTYLTGSTYPRAWSGDRDSYEMVQGSRGIYAAPQAALPYRSRFLPPGPALAYPSKQGPAVYATPQGPAYDSLSGVLESDATLRLPHAAPPPPPTPDLPTPTLPGL